MPIVIPINIVISLIIAAKLYSDAPEKEGIGFNKYWQTLMMDSYPSTDKNILIYNDKPERHHLFKVHRIVSITAMSIIGINLLLLILLN